MEFKYFYKNKVKKDIKSYLFSIGEIEYFDLFIDDLELSFSSFYSFDKYLESIGYKLLKRCLNSGLKDKNGVEIYEGDIVKWNIREHICIA